MRTFISLPVAEEVKTKVKNAQKQIQANNKGPDIKWTKPEQMHVTLKFIGDIDQDDIGDLSQIIEKASGSIRPFELSYFKLDVFPHPDNPSVIIDKLKESSGRESFELEKNLRAYLKKYGFQFDKKKWIPHVTLGRVKEDNADIRFPNTNQEFSWEVNEIHLKKSELSQQGPGYTTIESFKI
ncbi:MAG: RNA 2',3'-cyclic phosphodiesterase [Candidatus Magasanikbacteria bacterium]